MDHQLDKYSLTTNLFKEFVLQTTVLILPCTKFADSDGMVIECFYV